MKRLWIYLLAISLFSCQEEVDLPLATIDGIVPVIEGTWTDQNAYNEVRISLAQNYFDTTDRQIISDALVFIMIPGTEKRIRFSYRPESLSFRPVNPREVAKVGETYQLVVEWQDNIFSSKGLMLEAPTVDSLTYQFEEERLFREEGYYIKVYGKIPFEEDNNYRIRVIENDTLKNDRDDYLLFDDTFGLTFFEEGLELGYAFDPGDRVGLELYRMNRDMFDYLSQLVNLLFSDGGLFSPPPQNPDSNIKVERGDTEVLGFFLVSPVLRENIFIKVDK
ncbi:MAG: DUF4249 family protein [Algoriphagus sp.]|nr:DUF4249 family protein [Algoriphagus sp.]